MPGQAPALAAAGLVEELKARREEEGEDTLDKRLGVVKELAVGRFVVEIDGDGAVCAGRFGGLSHVSSPCRWLSVAMRHREGNALKDQAYGERIGASPLNAMECGHQDGGDTKREPGALRVRHGVMGLMPANGSVHGVHKGTDEGGLLANYHRGLQAIGNVHDQRA